MEVKFTGDSEEVVNQFMEVCEMHELDVHLIEDEIRAHQKEVAKFLMEFASDLLQRAMVHDDSKLQDPERDIFIRVTQKLVELEYGSEEYRKQLEEMGPALCHHYQYNSHHPEHRNSKNDLSRMSLADVVEMFCDWRAGVKQMEYGDIKKSIDINGEKFSIPRVLSQIFRNTVDRS